jgi:hypothetical protein
LNQILDNVENTTQFIIRISESHKMWIFPLASFSVISVFAFASVSEVKQSLSFKLELMRHSLLQLH